MQNFRWPRMYLRSIFIRHSPFPPRQRATSDTARQPPLQPQTKRTVLATCSLRKGHLNHRRCNFVCDLLVNLTSVVAGLGYVGQGTNVTQLSSCMHELVLQHSSSSCDVSCDKNFQEGNQQAGVAVQELIQEEMIQDAKKGQDKKNAVQTAIISNATLHGLRASPRACKANPRGVRSSGFGFRGVLGFLVWLLTRIGGHAVQPQGSSQSSSRTNAQRGHTTARRAARRLVPPVEMPVLPWHPSVSAIAVAELAPPVRLNHRHLSTFRALLALGTTTACAQSQQRKTLWLL